jgi:hypothetical protein
MATPDSSETPSTDCVIDGNPIYFNDEMFKNFSRGSAIKRSSSAFVVKESSEYRDIVNTLFSYFHLQIENSKFIDPELCPENKLAIARGLLIYSVCLELSNRHTELHNYMCEVLTHPAIWSFFETYYLNRLSQFYLGILKFDDTIHAFIDTFYGKLTHSPAAVWITLFNKLIPGKSYIVWNLITEV